MAQPTPPSDLTAKERELFQSNDTREVYVNPLLHQRLKLHAVREGKSVREVAEEPLWPLVGGKPEDPATPEGKP